MPGIILDNVLSKVRQSDLENFEKKIAPMEEDKKKQLIQEGLKNADMVVEESQKANMDINDLGSELPPVEVDPVVVDQNTPGGKEMFQKFLEQLK